MLTSYGVTFGQLSVFSVNLAVPAQSTVSSLYIDTVISKQASKQANKQTN